MPVSVCLGLGTNQSAHVGDSELSRYVDYINEDLRYQYLWQQEMRVQHSIIIQQSWTM